MKAWDDFTIQHEPISSIDLMERAAQKCAQWIIEKEWSAKQIFVFCGKGNNGGDGLAIARILSQSGFAVRVFILETGRKGSDDFEINLQRLQETNQTEIHFLKQVADFPLTGARALIIDALFGSGLNKPLEGVAASLVYHINSSNAVVISIDLPSGMFIDRSSKNHPVIKADHTLSFHCYKLGLLVQENAGFVGDVHLLDIGLLPEYLKQVTSKEEVIDRAFIKTIFKKRNRFAHKGNFGHALIVGGSYGKMGAAVLATKACLSSGAGLTTAFIPQCGYVIMQTSAPEAMALIDEEEKYLTKLPDEIEKFNAIGIGPGMGTESETQNLLSFLIRRYQKPIVIDADGLNCLATNKELLKQLPPLSILTPHPKEFDRLFGDHENDFDRIEKAKQKAIDLNVVIVLKSHHTLIALPDGNCYFNSTGNAGMAKGGSGDVLTGIITSLVAQGYKPAESAILGVYVHGLAGDFAAEKFSKEAMLPSHLIHSLSNVFNSLQ